MVGLRGPPGPWSQRFAPHAGAPVSGRTQEPPCAHHMGACVASPHYGMYLAWAASSLRGCKYVL